MRRKHLTDLARRWLQSTAAMYAWAALDGASGLHHLRNSPADLGPAMFVRFRRLIKKASTTMEYGVVAAGIGLAIITIVDRLGTMLPQ